MSKFISKTAELYILRNELISNVVELHDIRQGSLNFFLFAISLAQYLAYDWPKKTTLI